MTSDDQRMLRELFAAACDLSGSDREAFLDRECRDDAGLRRALEALLAGDATRSDIFADDNLGAGAQLLDMDEGTGTSADEAYLPGTKISGRYRIVSLIGHGGMGDVYRAEDLKLGSPVALKFLRHRLSDDPRAFDYFINEVRLSRRVAHPNVCRVYDIGETDHRHFISMEFVDGEDLQSLLRRIGRLPEAKGLEIARQLCLGLAAAHEKGVLHRDLKPANVMIDGRGQARITDFGLAVPASDAGDSGPIVGTPAYMAPEQLSGGAASNASDLYSLGLVLYELFTGQRVHSTDSIPELRRAHAGPPPKPPSAIVADIHPDVERVVLACLERDPRRRPASAHAIATALPGRTPLEAVLLAGDTPSPELVASASDRRDFSRKAKIGVIASVLVGMVLCGLFSVRSQAVIGFDAGTLIRPRDVTDLVRALGYDELPLDSTWGREWIRSYFGLFQTDGEARAEWTRLTGGPPTASGLWYRESHLTYLVSEAGHGPFAAMFVTPTDPPPLDPGMISVRVDSDGRLLEFVAPPVGQTIGERLSEDRDWLSLLLEAARIDRNVIEEEFSLRTENDDLPPLPVYADARMSWESGSGRILIDAAGYRGRPVYFRLTPEIEAAPSAPALQLSLGLVVVSLVGAALILGRRNWVGGRADRRGTARMFVFILVVSYAYWLFQAHHVADGGEAVMVLKTTARSLARAIVICAAYVGLEPYLRAWKPDVLIAWNRLIRGQLRDSVVGRSVLVGVLGGVVAQIVGSLGLLFGEPRQIALLADPVLEIGVGPFDLRPLMGPLSALGQIAADLFVSLATFVWIALFFFALRSVLRRNWAAAIAFVFFYAGLPMFASGDLHGGITGAIWWSLLLFLFYRFGIVTTMVCWLTWQLLTWPISLDFGGPGLDIGFLSYLLVGGLALYGFHMCFAVRRAASTPA